MEKSVVSKGKTVKLAIETALDLLEASKQEVHIEILETEAKSFFGKAKPAVVRVTLVRPKAVSEPANHAEASVSIEKLIEDLIDSSIDAPGSDAFSVSAAGELGGHVWVVGGMIHCKDAPDQHPMMTPCPGVKIVQNGVMVEKTVEVKESDRFEISFEEEAVEPVWSIDLDERKLMARLTVTPGYRMDKKLEDLSPARMAVLRVEQSKQFIPLDPLDIEQKLRQLGVVFGIQHDEIGKACMATVPGQFIIAAGKAPEAGSHGEFKSLLDTTTRKSSPKEREDGTVDFREIKEFPSVDKGSVIGMILPPVPGKPGTAVTGAEIVADPVQELRFVEGKGVSLIDSGSKIVALQAGMPQIQQKGQILTVSIVPKLVHGGDVDLASGNIHFQGDVEITGSVQDGMTVDALGNVTIQGNSNMATVSATQSIIVRSNIITSNVTAGKGSIVMAEIEPILREIIRNVKMLQQAVIQVSGASAFKVADLQKTGLRTLIQVLLQGKFKGLHQQFTQLAQKLSAYEAELEPAWGKYVESVHKGFLNPVSSTFHTAGDVAQFVELTEGMFALCQLNEEVASFMKFNYAHNSYMYSGGDMIVHNGCYNSTVHCRGQLQVNGFLRGGTYYAHVGTSIQEAGAHGGAATRIQVPADAFIKIARVMENTIIQVGNRSHQFMQNGTHIHARLDADGNLKLN
ncbi:flagellar assembly protein A [Paenibacillus turpanensis]|uniref:flagellar assembly protein A n=1 Tax=Paenibacillus turpanensis TaxID=2689078 RepID=UPI00140E1DE6|nr:FapA family protein [Paenibacillus turpanensis]